RIGVRDERLASDVSLKAFTTYLCHQKHAPPQIPHLQSMLSWVIQVFPNFRSWCQVYLSCPVYIVSRVS
ncbi:hypothetical protein L195_g060167, partial [Trifolium pratense]